MAEKTFHSITLPGQGESITARVPLTAAEFSPSVAYEVKDYCTYRGNLYRCTTAHAAGLGWKAAHFTPTDVDTEFDRKLDIPASQASAPVNPRVGDLWIDSDENSPIYNVDASPTLGSTNAVQSGGTKVALNSLDSRKMEHGVITGDFSPSVDYREGDLVFNSITDNGITRRILYRCTTDHDSTDWNPDHFTATTLEVELQKIRESEADTDMIGDLFGAKSTYAVGDYCIYNDNLYRCIRAVDNSSTSTPAFDPNDWTQVKLANDVSDLNSAFCSKYAGTKISIIGDSISTFNQNGYKIPGYAMYYPLFDVVSVGQTWWMKTINQSGAQLEINASYAGSRVTDTHVTAPDFYARTLLIGSPDMVFVALGTNDSINSVALGEYDYETTYTDLSESTFRTAYIKGIKSLQALYPNIKIVCVVFKMNDAYKDSILNIANKLDCDYVDASDYVIAQGAHPSLYGMRQIACEVLYPTDSTFTQIHTSADARKVGTVVNAIKTSINNIDNALGIDLTARLPVFGNYWINNVGQLQPSASWIAYKYSVDDFTVLRADLYGGVSSQKAIGFYSDAPSDETYIDGIRFDAGTVFDSNKYRAFTSILIPTNTKYVLLTSRLASGDAVITGFDNSLINFIPVLDSRVSSVENSISVLRESIDLSDADSTYNGYYNKNAGFSGNVNYRTYFFNTLNATEIINKVIAYTTSSVIPNIAFFSDVPPNANYDTCISTVPLSQGGGKVNTYENVTIPTGCKCIAIINYIESYPTASATMTRLLYDYQINSVEKEVESIKTEIFSHSNIKAIYPNVWNANDFCIVGDEFWFAKPYSNPGDSTERCEIRKYHVVNGAMVQKGSPIYTDFGHWNCVDYCPETDTLVFGNGGNGTETTGNWFAIVPHASELSGTVALADVGVKYNVDIGFKVQAVWGDSNLGQYNIVNLFANNATVIKKVLLTKTNGGYDGNYIVLESGSNETPIGVGGADVWGDTMYIGSTNFVIAKMSMTDYSVDIIEKKFYSVNGTACTGSMQGICVDHNYIWTFFNINGAEANNYLIQYYR